MRKNLQNNPYEIIILCVIMLLTLTYISPAYPQVTEYKLADISLCIKFTEAKSTLLNAGYQYHDQQFIRINGNIQEIVTLDSSASAQNETGLVTTIHYFETGKYSPLEIGNMINQERLKFINQYGQPTECDSFSATVFAFSCYYGEPKRSKPLLKIAANKKGKKHSLSIKDCN